MRQVTKIDEIVGNNIRIKRMLGNMTQTELGNALTEPLSPQQICKYELGYDAVSASRLVDIAKAFNCPLTDLFEGVSEEAHKIERVGHRALMAAHYSGLPPAIQESLRELMKALCIAMGSHLKSTERNNV